MILVAVAALVLLGGVLALVVLTGVGARRRGQTALPASLAGVFFPVTWVVWYLRDERPYRQAATSSPKAGFR